jgi:putative spermidine/putrescine transport system permease protein
MKRRGLRPWDVLWLVLAALYFLVPLVGSLEFSLETGATASGATKYGFDNYTAVLQDPNFQQDFLFSFQLALFTVALSIALMVPTIYWVHLKLPGLRRLFDFIAVLPFVVPPVALAVGVVKLFNSVRWFGFGPWMISGPQILVCVYVILALPFTYRALDAGMRSIDVRTLTEAAQSLGAGWGTVLLRIMLPNLRAAIIAAAFLTITLVMGEFTISSLLLFNTFSVYMNDIGNTQGTQAAALAMISLLLTWAALLAILFVGRGRHRDQLQVGGAR